MFPFWAIPLIGVGVSTGLQLLKPVASKLPAWLVPFINLGIGIGTSFLGSHGVPISNPAVLTQGLAISGSAALIHNTVKNLSRGDSWGQGPGENKPS